MRKKFTLKVNQKVWWHSGYGNQLVKIDSLENGVWVSSKLHDRISVDVRDIEPLNFFQKILLFFGLIKF